MRQEEQIANNPLAGQVGTQRALNILEGGRELQPY